MKLPQGEWVQGIGYDDTLLAERGATRRVMISTKSVPSIPSISRIFRGTSRLVIAWHWSWPGLRPRRVSLQVGQYI